MGNGKSSCGKNFAWVKNYIALGVAASTVLFCAKSCVCKKITQMGGTASGANASRVVVANSKHAAGALVSRSYNNNHMTSAAYAERNRATAGAELKGEKGYRGGYVVANQKGVEIQGASGNRDGSLASGSMVVYPNGVKNTAVIVDKDGTITTVHINVSASR